MLLLHLSTVQ